MYDIVPLRAALRAARDGLLYESDLDDETAAALRRWLAPHGPAGAAWWPASDIEALLGGVSHDT
jgi:hypothetical protein